MCSQIAMANKVASVGFLGAGHIASALIRGLLAANYVKGENIIASATSQQSVNRIEQTLGVQGTINNVEVAQRSNILWLAMKPHALTGVLRDIAPAVTSDHIIISAAAGITLKAIEKNLPQGSKVVRCMPNTPVMVLNGVTVYASGSTIEASDKSTIDDMFSSLGYCVEMQEHYMDIMTALTGCGPTYMYVMMDALADGGVYAGIPKDIALKLVAHTMIGSAQMVLQNGYHPQQLKDQVCSPAGTSIQAVRSLERAGFRGIMMDAVHSASKRALELSHLENGEAKDVYVKK